VNKIHFKFKGLNKDNKNKSIILIIFLCLISVIGILLVLFLTSRFGAGLTPDSAAYLAGAKNIASGNGITILYNDARGLVPLKLWASTSSVNQPLIFHWPPFYSIVLSLFVLTKINLLNGARILNSIFFGINIFLICHIIWKSTKSLIMTLLSGIIFLSSIVMLGLHTFIMSEPLFVLSGFSAIFILLSYFENKKIHYFIFAVILLGISFLTRYIGVAFILTSAIAVFLFDKAGFKNKSIRFFSLILISFAPMIVWLYRTSVAGNNLTDREILFHPPSIAELGQIPGVILKWFLIKDLGRIVNFFILILLIAIIIILTVFIAKRVKKDSNGSFTFKLICILLAFIPVYIFILILSRTFFDAKIPMAQDRLLAPLFIAFLIIFILLVSYFSVFFIKKKYIKAVILLGIFIFSGFYIVNGFNWSRNVYINGQGYSQKSYIDSKFVEEIKKIPAGKIIYSDATDIIYLYTGRQAYVLPAVFNPYTEAVNKNFEIQIREMFAQIDDSKGVIIDFSNMERPFLPAIEDLKRENSICLNYKDADGEIYEVCSGNLEKIFTSDYKNFTDYWRSMNQCSFETIEDNIKVAVTGDDPWFESKFDIDFTLKRPLMLVIYLDTEKEGEIRIFYGRDDRDYTLGDSYGYPLIKDFNKIYFKIPYNYYGGNEAVEKVRIDPINMQTDVKIEKIELFYIDD